MGGFLLWWDESTAGATSKLRVVGRILLHVLVWRHTSTLSLEDRHSSICWSTVALYLSTLLQRVRSTG